MRSVSSSVSAAKSFVGRGPPARCAGRGRRIRSSSPPSGLDQRHLGDGAAAGRTAEAHVTMTRALAEGTEDGRLFLHAGVIAAAGNRRAEARKWLRKAEALRSTLLPSELDELTKHLAALSPLEES